MRFQNVVTFCQQKQVRISASNLAKGALIIDFNGELTRASGLRPWSEANSLTNQQFLDAAEIFTVRTKANICVIFSREEFVLELLL
jgi:hypothetical protein